MNNVITNELLTDEEVKELTSLITSFTKDDDFNIDKETEIDAKFNRALDYFYKHQTKFSKMPFVEIFKWFYYLGVNTDINAKELNIGEVLDYIEREEFIENVSSFLKDSKNLPSNLNINVDKDNNLVRLISECRGGECPCSPQREDCCDNESDICTSIVIPMSKFNKLINLKGEK